LPVLNSDHFRNQNDAVGSFIEDLDHGLEVGPSLVTGDGMQVVQVKNEPTNFVKLKFGLHAFSKLKRERMFLC